MFPTLTAGVAAFTTTSSLPNVYKNKIIIKKNWRENLERTKELNNGEDISKTEKNNKSTL